MKLAWFIGSQAQQENILEMETLNWTTFKSHVAGAYARLRGASTAAE